MKAKIVRGAGFLGSLNYTSDARKRSGDKKAVLILSNLDTTQTIPQQALQMRRIALRKPNIKKPVVHFSLSLPPGEKISNEKWAAIAEDFLKKMGLDASHQFRVDQHNDKDHQHIHIVANRVSVGGKVWLGKNDVFQAIDVTQQLEKIHGLTLTQGLYKPEKRSPTSNETGKAKRTGKIQPRIFLQYAIDTAKKQSNSFPEFVDALQKLRVQVLPAGKSGSVPGCSFAYDGLTFKGSDLGGAYKFAAIKEATNYDQVRDAELIQKLRSAAPVAPAAAAGVTLDPYIGRPGPRKNGGSIESGDDDAAFEKARRRKDFQQRMLEKTYQTSINSLLVDMLRYVRIVNGQVEISLEPGGKIIDTGDSITASTGSGDEIKASIELAKTKGWKTIEFSGSASFVERAALAAMKNGFPESSVSAKNPAHQAAIKRAKIKYSEYQHECNQRNARAGDRANSERIDAAGSGTTSEERARNRAELGETDPGQGGKALPSPSQTQADAARPAPKPARFGQSLADFNADGQRSDGTVVDRDRSKF